MSHPNQFENIDCNALKSALSADDFAILATALQFFDYPDAPATAAVSSAEPEAILVLASKESLPKQVRQLLARYAQVEQHAYFLSNRDQYARLLTVLAYTAEEEQRKPSFLALLNFLHLGKLPPELTARPLAMVGLCLQNEQQYEMAISFLQKALAVSPCSTLSQFIEERLEECQAEQVNADAMEQALVAFSS